MMEYRKIAIYGIFVISVAYGIYFHFIANNSVKIVTAVPTAEPESNPAPFIAGLAIQAGGREVPPVSTPRSKFGSDSWVRNPFGAGGSISPAPAPAAPISAPAVIKPRLSAISGRGPKGMAVLNGKIIQIGEKIGDWTLVKVTDDSVLLEGPGGSLWVKLGG